MDTLHTLNKAQGCRDVLDRCLSSLNKNDCLLLLENGVYALVGESEFCHIIRKKLPDDKIFCLMDDVRARGILHKLPATITCIEYSDFVRLTEQYHRIISWF